MSQPKMEFGYHPPSGYRGFEIIRPREYLSDLHRALDIASQSFDSLWVSDHFAYNDEFRIECWTHLTLDCGALPRPKTRHGGHEQLFSPSFAHGKDGRQRAVDEFGTSHIGLWGGLV